MDKFNFYHIKFKFSITILSCMCHNVIILTQYEIKHKSYFYAIYESN